jgi:hypothetical protein
MTSAHLSVSTFVRTRLPTLKAAFSLPKAGIHPRGATANGPIADQQPFTWVVERGCLADVRTARL